MFGWRRRSEGFEWQEYVRTTILVRRADRQKRIDDARIAAIEKVQNVKERGIEAGKAGVDLAAEKAAGAAKAAGRTLGDIAVAGAYGALGFAKSAGDVAVKIVKPYLPDRPDRIEADPEAEKPVHERYAELREQRRRLEPIREPVKAVRPPREPRPLPDIGPRVRMAASYAMRGAVALAVILGVGHVLQSGDLETGGVTRVAAITTEPIELDGRATAVAGDTLRLNGQLVKFSGVAAPEDNQPCYFANGRRWSCASAARKALDRLVRGKRVVCAPSGSDESGVTLAACQTDGEDLARAMTRAGHVFADTGIFAAYRADEDAARENKAGVWQGESVRPSEWRARIWEEAKGAAPDGCPIKGIVRSGEQIYAMPWSNEYSASRFRPAKAERWFCSEGEARDAGFKSSVQL